jgi:uncharacterized protein with HEPN domain
MIKRVVRGRLEDILAAIDEIEEASKGLDLGSYRQSGLERRAIERCLEIVSEASRHIPLELLQRHPQIPWGSIRGIGNVLRHEYGAVDDDVIWRTATRSVTALKPVIQNLLDQIINDS